MEEKFDRNFFSSIFNIVTHIFFHQTLTKKVLQPKMIRELVFLVFYIILQGCGMRLEAYWEASYVLPRTEECWIPRPPKTASPNIDLKKHVPRDFPSKDLIINIAFADFDPDR